FRGVPLAEVEFEPVKSCKTGEGQSFEFGNVFAIAPRDQGEHVVSVIVPRAERRMRILACDNAKLREGWRGYEALVGEDFVSRGMIDGEKTELIEIDSFFHRLHEAETQHAVER